MWGGGGADPEPAAAPGCGLCLNDEPGGVTGAAVGSGGGGGGGNSGCDGGVSCGGVLWWWHVRVCTVSLVCAKSVGEWPIGASGVV